MTPSVTIVIPTHNRADKLTSLLDRILADPDDHEVLVVNDGSTDRTRDLLDRRAREDSRLVPLHVPAMGLSSARITAARAASHDLLVMYDDDIMPMPRLAHEHALRHRGRSQQLVLGYMPTHVPDPLPRGSFATVLYAQEYERRCAEYDIDPSLVLTGLWLGNASITKGPFIEAWDSGRMPTFPYRHEDRIIGLVLRELGVSGVFDRALFAQHVHSRPLSAFLTDAYRNGQGREHIRHLFPDVLTEPSEHAYRHGVPAPLQPLLSATRYEPVRRAVTGALSTGIAAAGALGSRRAELSLARLARKVEELHGVREVGV